MDGIRYGASQDEPDAIAVRARRFGRKRHLLSVDDVERIDANQRRIVLKDPPTLLSE